MVDLEVHLELGWPEELALLHELCDVPCSAWNYGLERMYATWLLLVVACICVDPFRVALSRASYISMAVTRPNVFTMRRIVRVA